MEQTHQAIWTLIFGYIFTFIILISGFLYLYFKNGKKDN